MTEARLASHFERASVLIVLLGAFWLRIFRLDLQSIWSDEGLSIYRASQGHGRAPFNHLTMASRDTSEKTRAGEYMRVSWE